MRFNVDRLCELAGIDSSGRLLAESAHPMKYEKDEAEVPPAATKAPAMKAPAMKAPMKPGAAPANPAMEKKGMLKGLAHIDEIDVEDIDEDAYAEGMGHMHGMMEDEDAYAEGMGHMHGMMEDEDVAAEDNETVYEIDEQELNEAIYAMRTQRIQEGKVRQEVRKELKKVVSEMTTDSSWMYGNNKPARSQKGQVTRGFAGPGFKR